MVDSGMSWRSMGKSQLVLGRVLSGYRATPNLTSDIILGITGMIYMENGTFAGTKKTMKHEFVFNCCGISRARASVSHTSDYACCIAYW